MTRIANLAFANLLIAASLLFAWSPSISAAEANAASIERMKKDLTFLASDECEGRGVETEGINKAAEHIASEFRAIGLKPAMADGSYFQPFMVAGSSKLGMPNSFTLKGPENKELAPVVSKDFGISGIDLQGESRGGNRVRGLWDFDQRRLRRLQGRGRPRAKSSICLRQTAASERREDAVSQCLRPCSAQRQDRGRRGPQGGGDDLRQ